jgi:hypothetical protein
MGRTMPGSVTVTSTGEPSAGSPETRNGAIALAGSTRLPSGPTSYSFANNTASGDGLVVAGSAATRRRTVDEPVMISCESSGAVVNWAAWPGGSRLNSPASRDELLASAFSPGRPLIAGGLPPAGLTIDWDGPASGS